MTAETILSILTLILIIISFLYNTKRNGNKDIKEKIDKIYECMQETTKDVNSLRTAHEVRIVQLETEVRYLKQENQEMKAHIDRKQNKKIIQSE